MALVLTNGVGVGGVFGVESVGVHGVSVGGVGGVYIKRGVSVVGVALVLILVALVLILLALVLIEMKEIDAVSHLMELP